MEMTCQMHEQIVVGFTSSSSSTSHHHRRFLFDRFSMNFRLFFNNIYADIYIYVLYLAAIRNRQREKKKITFLLLQK